jgi:dihydrofolate synthase/folylpolyglutamate synthase
VTAARPWTYRDALGAIWDRSFYERGYVSNPFNDAASADRGLRRTAALLARLGTPQARYPIVHVAGSKGKGSTSALIAAALRAAGHRVGLATSPHLHAWRERVAIDGEPVAEHAFAALTERAIAAAERLEGEEPDLGRVTAFELLVAIGLDGCAAAGCDAAVVEVGLGGTYDATNVVVPIVSVVTRLDLEHTAVLGSTIEEIAANKAGIVKPEVPIVVSPQEPAALAVIERAAAERGAPLLVGGRDWRWTGTWRRFAVEGPWGRSDDLRIALPGAHQVENAATALAALWRADQAGLDVPEGAIRAGFAAARWPGRFERVTRNGVEVVLDGAHTPAAMAAVAATLAEEFPKRRAAVVLGAGADKDPAALARALAPAAAVVVATRAAHPRAASPAAVAAGAAAAALAVETRPTVAAALDRARELAGDALALVTGSLFAVAEAREALGLAVPDPAVLPRTAVPGGAAPA